MKNKDLESFLYSTVGIVVLLVVVIAVNAIVGFFSIRADLTENREYTLSEGTKSILSEIDTPVTIRFYATRNENYMPVQFRNYARRVEDLLKEYRRASNGKIKIEKLDPQPDSDAADLADLDGVAPQSVSLTEQIYLGLSVNMLDSKVAIPFLAPNRDRLLEYDISRAISSVANPTKKVVGVVSSLPMFGSQAPSNPMAPQQGGSEPWVFIEELQRTLDVRDLGASTTSIPDEVDLLMVVHPKNLAEETVYAIDQYLMGGGKLMVVLDPVATTDQGNPGANQMQRMMESGSDLPELLSAWGLDFDPAQVVADRQAVTQVQGQGGAPQEQPAVLSITPDSLNQDDVIASQVDSLFLVFAGAITGDGKEGIEMTPLIQTSEDSQLVQGFMARMNGASILEDFEPSGKRYSLAVRLSGKFPSAFPDGAPEGEDAAAEPESPDAEPVDTDSEHLAEASDNAAVVILGDSDFVYDQFAVRVQRTPFGNIVQPQGGNLNFGQSLVEQMAGDEDLIRVRSRASIERPFTKIREMQQKARAKYQDKLASLQEELEVAEQRINELQSVRQGQDSNQRFILSPEQQEELEKFRETRARTNQELKELRRDLRRDIEALQRQLKWVNIALVPFIVTVGGVTVAVRRKKKTSAK